MTDLDRRRLDFETGNRMAATGVYRAQAVVKFVIAWLIGLYLFELVTEGQHWVAGSGAVLAIGVNIYARRKAAATVNPTPLFYLWLYLPVAVLFLVPVIATVVPILTGRDERTWWNHLASVLPFLLKLGVPVVALLGVSLALGRIARNETFVRGPEASDDS